VIRFHPSSIGLLMGEAKSVDISLLPPDLLDIAAKPRKTDADKELLRPYHEISLSAGAKTVLRTMAKEYLFGYHKTVETKFMDKGLACEAEAIRFLNHLWFKNYEKNTTRLQNDLLTGECDILDPGIETIDTKVSWDLSTFPLLEEDAYDMMYEWQGRGYMQLYDVPQHRVAHVMLDTPEDLIKPWEQRELHEVSHLPQHLRVTVVTFKRDMKLEDLMNRKLRVAQQYLQDTLVKINLEHRETA